MGTLWQVTQYLFTSWHRAHACLPSCLDTAPCWDVHEGSLCGMSTPRWHFTQSGFGLWHAVHVERMPMAPWSLAHLGSRCVAGRAPGGGFTWQRSQRDVAT